MVKEEARLELKIKRGDPGCWAVNSVSEDQGLTTFGARCDPWALSGASDSFASVFY